MLQAAARSARLLTLLSGRQQLAQIQVSRSFSVVSEPAQDQTGSAWGDTRILELLNDRQVDCSWLSCSQEDLVIDAVNKMAKSNVGSLMVYDPAKLVSGQPESQKTNNTEAVVGIITERDYLTKLVVAGKSSATTKVANIMTPKARLIMLTPQNTVIQAMELMADHNIRHVPVVQNDEMVGMISIRDVVKEMVHEYRQSVSVLKDYIQGSY